MAVDLYAGIPVNDYAAALAWYERLLGSPPSFFPHDTEAVWELAEHRSVDVVQRPEHAGHAMHTVIVEDLDTLMAEIAKRGLEPAPQASAAASLPVLADVGRDPRLVAPADQPVDEAVGQLADVVLGEPHPAEVRLVQRYLCERAERLAGVPAGQLRVGLRHDQLLDHQRSVRAQQLAGPRGVVRGSRPNAGVTRAARRRA
jgi:hypothetical protein